MRDSEKGGRGIENDTAMSRSLENGKQILRIKLASMGSTAN